MTEFEPLHANAVMRIRREGKAEGLDEVGIAWTILAAQERAIVGELMQLLPGPCYMDPPDGGSVTVMEQLRRMADDARKWREQHRPAKHSFTPPCLCDLCVGTAG
jgi:hypothetical protein